MRGRQPRSGQAVAGSERQDRLLGVVPAHRHVLGHSPIMTRAVGGNEFDQAVGDGRGVRAEAELAPEDVPALRLPKTSFVLLRRHDHTRAEFPQDDHAGISSRIDLGRLPVCPGDPVPAFVAERLLPKPGNP